MESVHGSLIVLSRKFMGISNWTTVFLAVHVQLDMWTCRISPSQIFSPLLRPASDRHRVALHAKISNRST
jgi:membrane-bound metal-dependent hydrolase YbcI (DUF457 family)